MAEDEFVQRLLTYIVKNEDWAVIVVNSDPAEQLARLTRDLQRPYSHSGDGKLIMTGFAYMDTMSTLAWAKASGDLYYPVMKAGIETFCRRWARVRTSLGSTPHHYVSLGPGTGQKDDFILRDLDRRSRALSYWAVDMSDDMIKLAIRQVLMNSTLPRDRIAPVQLDFSRLDNLLQLRSLVESMVDDEPVLYSLLGNTMANFADDARVLTEVVRVLLRPQDRLLLEVATTGSLSERAAELAAAEYAGTRAFREFVTSSLFHYTDLTIDEDCVVFDGSVESDRALLIKAIYRNQTGQDVVMTLPDRSRTLFSHRDTIRLNITRKYARRAVPALLSDCGVDILAENHWELEGGQSMPGFGMDIFLLQGSDTSYVRTHREGFADAIWSRRTG